jgi:putative hydrolase of HD superfamily
MKDVVKYLYEMGQLKRVQRSGWWVAGISKPETVAEHSFRVAILGYILAYFEGADPMKTAMMCLFHDTQEARLNDLHAVARRYVNWEGVEERAFWEQVERLPQDIKEKLLALMHDYESEDSFEAQLAHDADRLECLIQAREYQAQGYGDVQDWINNSQAALTTESAKRVAEECLRVEPSEWWQGLKTIKRVRG